MKVQRLCIALSVIIGMCGITAHAGQNMELSQPVLISVNGNDGEHVSVTSGDAGLECVSGGDHMNSDTVNLEQTFISESATEPVSVPVFSLQVPNNLDFVIDPWNLSGRGQIYSERFMIRNCGNTACVIQLRDIACQGSDGVVIVGDAGQIYGQHTANVYLEMVFENGETIVLSGEGREHTATLEPGDELIFWFAGAVNEKATEGWENKKISVKLKYFPTVE